MIITKPPIKLERRADEIDAKKRHSVFVTGFKPERIHKTRLRKMRMIVLNEIRGLPSVVLPTVSWGIKPTRITNKAPKCLPPSLQELVDLKKELLQSILQQQLSLDAVGRIIERLAADEDSDTPTAEVESPAPTGLEPPHELVAALAQAAQARKALIRSNAILPSYLITKRLDMSRQALNKAIHANRLFALEFNGILYYPAFFADPTIARRALERVCKALGSINSWEKWQFFTSPTVALSNRTPLEALREGDVKAVVAAAEGFAE